VATPDLLEVYAPITKKERDPKTGHLHVYGKITGPDLDHDQQRMDPTWLKTAVPDWFRRGNIREGHDYRRAVGKALELEEKDDGWYIAAKIVDRDAAEKVEEEVLNGFSIGIRGWGLDHSKADAPGGVVVSGRIFETSLVDAPCLGSATISDHWTVPLAKSIGDGELQPIESPVLVRVASPTYGLPLELFDRLASPVKQALADLAGSGAQVAAAVVKSESAEDSIPVVVNVTVQTAEPDLAKGYTAEEKHDALAAGEAMKNPEGDPAYTIKTKADLRKAIKAVGRGNADHDAIRKHIIKRAKALGLESMVPDTWNADGSLKDEAAKADAATIEKAESVLRDARTLVPDLAKADDAAGGEDEGDDIAGAQAAIAAIAKLIVSEAESLALGNLNEACDIALLLDAVRALKWFQSNERNEQAGDDSIVMMLAESADDDAPADDLLKAAAKGKNPNLAPPFKKKAAPDDSNESDDDPEDGDDTDEDDGRDKAPAKKKAAPRAKAEVRDAPGDEQLLTKAEAAEIVKAAVAAALAKSEDSQTPPAAEPETVTKAELADLVKAAMAEARAADEERTNALTVDVAKAAAFDAVKDLPQPGGPALTRTAAQQSEATKSDAQDMRAQAALLKEKAKLYAGNRDLAQGYLDRARALERAAA
jgi:hypothetical protein